MTDFPGWHPGRKGLRAVPLPEDELEELKQLLLAPEQADLREVLDRLDDPAVRAAEMAKILPDAIAKRAEQDSRLIAALRPTVEEIVKDSVRRDPRTLADSLFPAMGPAIGKSIAAFVRRMVQWLNETLENTFSLKRLTWRLESFRTGKPFAEIVLHHSLVYRVEQIFLIHKATDSVLNQAPRESQVARDADDASDVLIAIQDFVHDSLDTYGDENQKTLRLGDLSVIVEQGPKAYLAAVVRGTPPEDLRYRLRETLVQIHQGLNRDLDSFDGNVAPFQATSEVLNNCLESESVKERESSFPYARVLAVGIIAVLCAWGFFAVRDHLRQKSYLDRLRAQKGIVVVSWENKNGKLSVTGLRDPLAVDPKSLIDGTGLQPEKVIGNWSPYQAMGRGMILTRAREALRPPKTVSLSLERGVLTAKGTARYQWIEDAAKLVELIPGITAFDRSELNVDYAQVMKRLRVRLSVPESVTLSLENGVLTATGTAPGKWIADTRRLALLEPAVKEYRDDGLAVNEALVLNEVRKALAPPKTVDLILERSVLTARGVAPYDWIKSSRAIAPLIPGISLYKDDRLKVDYDRALQHIQRVLAPPKTAMLSLQNGVLTATGSAPPEWIRTSRTLTRLFPLITEYRDRDLKADYSSLLAWIRKKLNPPDMVSLRIVDDVLVASGSAPHLWIVKARRIAQGFPQLAEYMDHSVKDLDELRFTELYSQIEQTSLHFLKNQIFLVPGQAKVATSLAGQFLLLQRLGRITDKNVYIEIKGHGDATGTERRNATLSKQRAERVAEYLRSNGVNNVSIASKDARASEPSRADTSNQEPGMSSRVTFAINVQKAGIQGGN